jgi:DNA-binding CsgD family transcriptional regulator
MFTVDAGRRLIDVNRPARLWFRVSSEDATRRYTIEDLAPADQLDVLEREWARMLHAGWTVSHYLAARPDGSRVGVVCFALAHVLAGLHVFAFAPADWPEDESVAVDGDEPDLFASLTAREIEVLAFAANGLSGPELAEQLALSPHTVNTHFKNIHEKLGVRSRAAAVARAMRLGVID